MVRNVGYWMGQADLVTVQHPKGEEVLKWAKRSGLTLVSVGWESNNHQTLNEFKAKSKQGKNRREAVRKIRDAGIEVMLFMALGGLNDTLDDFKRAKEVCDELKVPALVTLITPLPGTELYSLYQDRIFHDLEWDKYNFEHAVFEHSGPSMSVENREQALVKLRKELYTWPRIISSICNISLKGFPWSHMASFMFQYQVRTYVKNYTQCLNGSKSRSK